MTVEMVGGVGWGKAASSADTESFVATVPAATVFYAFEETFAGRHQGNVYSAGTWVASFPDLLYGTSDAYRGQFEHTGGEIRIDVSVIPGRAGCSYGVGWGSPDLDTDPTHILTYGGGPTPNPVLGDLGQPVKRTQTYFSDYPPQYPRDIGQWFIMETVQSIDPNPEGFSWSGTRTDLLWCPYPVATSGTGKGTLWGSKLNMPVPEAWQLSGFSSDAPNWADLGQWPEGSEYTSDFTVPGFDSDFSLTVFPVVPYNEFTGYIGVPLLPSGGLLKLWVGDHYVTISRDTDGFSDEGLKLDVGNYWVKEIQTTQYSLWGPGGSEAGSFQEGRQTHPLMVWDGSSWQFCTWMRPPYSSELDGPIPGGSTGAGVYVGPGAGGGGAVVPVGSGPIYNPWSSYAITGTWQDHMSYSLGGIDYPLAYGTAIAAPAAGTLHTSGGSGEYETGWVGSAGRRSILYLDQPFDRTNPNFEQNEGSGPMVAIVFQHQSQFGGDGQHYAEGDTVGYSGASADGADYGGDIHLHVHGLTAGGQRVDFLNFI